MRETMPERRPGDSQLVEFDDGATPVDSLDVLYLDADADIREATRRAVEARRDVIAVASVASVEAALEVATDETDCLVIDPVGLEGSADRLLDRFDCPVIYYTTLDAAAFDDDLLAGTSTIVEKTPETIRGEFLAEKIVGITSANSDREEQALTVALADVERRAREDERTLLAEDDGTVVWSSAPLADCLPGDPPDEANIDEWVETSLSETAPGRAALERIRDNSEEPVTVRVDGHSRYCLWTEERLPPAAGSLRLIQIRDVTDQVRREARERLLDLLVEFAEDGLYTLDAKGYVDFCNEAFASMLGYEQSELLGTHVSELLAEDQLASGQASIQQLIAESDRQETTVDMAVVRSDGTERELSVHYSLLEGPDGGYLGLLGVTRDVTERNERKRELERYKQLFDNLVGSFPGGGVFLFDEDMQFVEAGGQDLARVGLEAADVVGNSPSEVFPPENAERLEDAYSDALEGRQRTFEDSFGGYDYVVQVLPIENVEGDAVAGMAVAQNVTERRDRERELEETTERLKLALEGANLGVWDWNIETGDVRFDERWTGMLGYDHGELEHRLETWEDLVHPDDIDEAWETIQRHFDGETDMYECDHRLRTKSGDYRWIRDLGRVFERDEDGEALRMVGIHQDITERKERQQELEAQHEELETLTQIHVLIQEVIRALGSAVTREEIEELVCRRLVESEYYELAWIGERAVGKHHLDWKAGAGDGGYHVVVSERSEEVEREDDPGMTAVETGDVQVIHDIRNDDRMIHWREEALSRGFRSAAVVPLVHEGVVHSALLVYANRAEAFSERAIESFRVLGEMVGFAFTAVQNRHLLLEDRVVELEFKSTDKDNWLVAVALGHDCRLSATGCIDIGERFLQYVTVDGGDPEAVLETFLSVDPVTGGRVVRTDGDHGRLELTVTQAYEPALLDAGARLTEIVAEGDELTITAEAPLDADPRTVHRTLSADIDGLQLTSKRERTHVDDGGGDSRDALEQLTDRQAEILRAAYLAGYYAWPRDTTAEELAESLDISSPTLHQHLRRAKLNLLESLLDV
ncbi:PAS domain S-box protein [Halomicroarcula sp. GCM10025324]|uniref:PAS domain S-box protein n=1 Tax=Haloarcula TaxID=2237 RepID=UPI0023E80DE8|nr:PAS domain S-box protein [Halomicroarcula sp. ZS-22-S1]